MEAIATLEYAKVDQSAEMLRRRVRRIVAWVTIAYAAGCFVEQFLAYRPLVGNLVNLGGEALARVGIIWAALISIFPLMIVAGVMLLLEKPWAMLVLRISAGMLILTSAVVFAGSYVSMRGSGIPDLALRQSVAMFTSACFPVLVALLPLQARKAG